MIPAFVERLKDDLDVLAGKAVQVGNYRIELVDLVLLFGLIEWPIVYTDRISPIGIAVVYGGEAACEVDDALAERII